MKASESGFQEIEALPTESVARGVEKVRKTRPSQKELLAMGELLSRAVEMARNMSQAGGLGKGQAR